PRTGAAAGRVPLDAAGADGDVVGDACRGRGAAGVVRRRDAVPGFPGRHGGRACPGVPAVLAPGRGPETPPRVLPARRAGVPRGRALARDRGTRRRGPEVRAPLPLSHRDQAPHLRLLLALRLAARAGARPDPVADAVPPWRTG